VKSLTYVSAIALVVVPPVVEAGEIHVSAPSPMGVATYQTTVVVTDDAGKTVSGLTEDRFLVTVDQNVVVIEEVFPVTSRWMVVALLIDKSGSMRGEALEAAKVAAVDFVNRCGNQTLYAVVPFDDTPVAEPTFSRREQGVVTAIAEIEVGNNTSLYDAIRSTLPHVASYWPPRKAMIALTDGKDTRSATRYADLLASVREEFVPIYTVGLGSDLDEERLDALAQVSGGRYFHAPKPADLLMLYRAIAAELEEGYVVRFDLPSVLAEDGTHVLEVTVTADTAVVTGRQLFYGAGDLHDLEQRRSAAPSKVDLPVDSEAASPWAAILFGIGIGLVGGAVLLLLAGSGDVGIRIVLAVLAAMLCGLVGALYHFM
jgi:VWFA-related protein